MINAIVNITPFSLTRFYSRSGKCRYMTQRIHRFLLQLAIKSQTYVQYWLFINRHRVSTEDNRFFPPFFSSSDRLAKSLENVGIVESLIRWQVTDAYIFIKKKKNMWIWLMSSTRERVYGHVYYTRLILDRNSWRERVVDKGRTQLRNGWMSMYTVQHHRRTCIIGRRHYRITNLNQEDIL